MLSLIVVFIFGLAVAFFATQNTRGVNVTLANSELSGVPLYVVVLISILLGLLMGWIISLVSSISSFFRLRGKDAQIQQTQSSVQNLERKVHDLEIENARLQSDVDNYKPSLKSKILASS